MSQDGRIQEPGWQDPRARTFGRAALSVVTQNNRQSSLSVVLTLAILSLGSKQ